MSVKYGFMCENSYYAPTQILNGNPTWDYKCKTTNETCSIVGNCKKYAEQEWIKEYVSGK